MSTTNRQNFSRRRSLARALRSAALTSWFAGAPTCAGLLLLGLAACDQAKPNCIATTNAFAVKLIELSRAESVAGACATFGPASFNADPELGLAPYYLRGSDGQPDYDRGSLAVQTAELGTLVYTAEGFGVANAATDGQLYSMGAFSGTVPDDNEICTIPTMSPTHVVLPEVPAIADDPATEDDESFPGQAAVDVALAWSNLQVYVTADTFGTQMTSEVVDTRLTPTGESCAITYRTLGLAPAVSCTATDADGNSTLDPSLCDPESNPAEGRVLGSGISPSARFECNAETGYCMIEGDTFPALR